MKLIVAFWCHWPGAPAGRASGQTDGQPIKVCCRRRVAAVLKTSKPTQEPAHSGRGGDGRGGEGVNKVLQPAQSVRLKASIINSVHADVDTTATSMYTIS